MIAHLRLAACAWLLVAAVAGGQTLSISDTMLLEGDTGVQNAIVFVTLSGVTPLTVSVDYFTQDDTATAGEDYQPTTGTLTFTGTAPQPVMVPIFGDLDVEVDETFVVILENSTGATVVDDSGEVKILNDDETIDVSIGDATVTEGDSGTVSALFPVQRAAPVMSSVTVSYQTHDVTATAGEDYRPAAGTVTLPPGSTSVTVAIDVFGDTLFEDDETFEVTITGDDGITIDDGEGTILDDDQRPTLAIGSAGVLEGDDGTVEATFAVTLSAPLPEPATVAYATRDGTASAASGDYRSASGTLTFAPGQTQQEIVVEVVGDTDVEPDETFFVDLSDATGATIVDPQGEGTIVNDDDQPLELSIRDVSVTEGDDGTTAATFRVDLSRAADAAVSVDYATADGTASVAGGDYLAAAGTLTFAPGQTQRQITVEIVGDTDVEDDETFSVALSNPTGATIVDGRGDGTIVNDDEVPPELSIDDVSVVEGDDGTRSAVFTAQLSRATDRTVSVEYATADGTATFESGDYAQTRGSLDFPPGQIRRELTVEVAGDTDVEDDETFSVLLSNPAGATVADDRGQGTILNDDDEPSRIRLLDAPSVVESAGSVAVAVERFAGADRAARVTVSAVAGTATAGEDFVVAARDFTWDAGERGRKVFELEILDDSLEEDDESVVLRLSSPVDSLLVDPAELTLVILDDDTPMGLAATGDEEVSADTGAEIELEVRASRDDGAPVEGAVVVWSIEGDAELLDEERTATDGEGLARQRLRLGSRPGDVVVTATIEGLDRGVEFMVTIESDLADAIDPTEDPGDASVARALDESCTDAGGDFGELCDYLGALDEGAEQQAAIAELTPEEIAAQAQLALSSQKTQLGNIGARLAALRGGGTRQAVEQLAILIRGKPLDLGGIRSAWATRRDDGRFAKSVDSALATALAGGVTGLQEGPESGALGDPNQTPIEAPRWGLYLNGRISLGDRPTTVRETGFDFETLGLTAGADYRLSDRLVLGGALGYLDSDTDLDRDGGKLDAQGYSLAAYAGYTRGSFYLDGVVSYGRNEYDLVRNIDLPQPFRGQQRFTALGSPDGDQVSVSLGGGYDAQIRRTSGATSWTVGGFGSLSWIDSDIDGYTERDAGPFNLVVAGQSVESLLSEAGLEVAYASSQSWGVLRPTLRLSWLHEFEDDARLIRALFAEDVTANEFVIPTEEPDRDFFNLTAGLTATMARGRTVYLIYETDLERDDLDVYTFTFGARFEVW